MLNKMGKIREGFLEEVLFGLSPFNGPEGIPELSKRNKEFQMPMKAPRGQQVSVAGAKHRQRTRGREEAREVHGSQTTQARSHASSQEIHSTSIY